MAQANDTNELKFQFPNTNVSVTFSLPCERMPFSESFTLKQVHGATGYATSLLRGERKDGDWLWTDQIQERLVIAVADCTAVMITGLRNKKRFVAALHAGWRGTAAGIISKALHEIRPDENLQAWLSPSICANHFEVGAEVVEAMGSDAAPFARRKENQKYLLALKDFQSWQLRQSGATVWISPLCTFCQPDFHSYRREGPSTIRHYSSIVINA